MAMTRLCLERVRSAANTIDPVFLNSPQYVCGALSRVLGCDLTIKLETANPVRCFKGRGTETLVSALAKEGNVDSVLCASAGNLGQALAFSAGKRGMKTKVVASASASPLKLDMIRQLGAEIHLVDADFETARLTAGKIAKEEGSFLVEDSLDIRTCEGAATMGLELAEISESFDIVLIALGAGAMASGVGFVMKKLCPKIEIVTVQPSGAPVTTLSLRAGKALSTETMNTIADGVAGRFTIPEVLEDLMQVIDDTILVEEESIIEGMRYLYQYAGLIVEPSAALGIAAILEDRERFAGKSVATIICGGNISPGDFERLVTRKTEKGT